MACSVSFPVSSASSTSLLSSPALFSSKFSGYTNLQTNLREIQYRSKVSCATGIVSRAIVQHQTKTSSTLTLPLPWMGDGLSSLNILSNWPILLLTPPSICNFTGALKKVQSCLPLIKNKKTKKQNKTKKQGQLGKEIFMLHLNTNLFPCTFWIISPS